MNYSEAFTQIQDGSKVTRSSWVGIELWIEAVTEDAIAHYGWIGKELWFTYVDATYDFNDENATHLIMVTTEDTIIPWQPSETDSLAEDWVLVE